MVVMSPNATALAVRTQAQDEARARAVLGLRLRELRAEIERLKSHLHAIKHGSETVVREGVHWFDASAHDQLGPYPWLKLSAASLAAFMAGRLLHRIPLGLVAIAGKPLLFAGIRSLSR